MEKILKYFSGFSARQLEQLKSLEGLYKDWNEKINVISRKDIDGLYEKHVLHSLSIAAVFEFPAGSEIVDIGTGGGFPGIPLAIFFPEARFHLVDSIVKKLKVVEAVAASVGLTNVTTQHSRVEEIKNRKFDFVVSRAVAPLKDLWTWSKPLLRRNPKTETQKAKSPLSAIDYRLRAPDSRLPSPESPLPTPHYRLTTPDSELPTPGPRLPTSLPGLICLKGGDLSEEIRQSGIRPSVTDVHEIFPEEYFREKYILFAPL